MPLEYKLLGYSEVAVDPVPLYVPLGTDRPLRSGAFEEVSLRGLCLGFFACTERMMAGPRGELSVGTEPPLSMPAALTQPYPMHPLEILVWLPWLALL